MLRNALIALALLGLLVSGATASDAPLYTNGPASRALLPYPYSPTAFPGATSALWTNPAGIGADGSSGFLFTKPASADAIGNVYGNDWGLGANMGEFGFGVEAANGANSARRYTWGLAMPLSEGFNLGFAYHWSSDLDRQNSYDLGLLVRPTRWASIGATMVDAFGGRYNGVDVDPTYKLGLAVRPLGPNLTLTADATLYKDAVDDYGDELDPTFTANWNTGMGLVLRGGYALDSEIAFAGLGFTFGTTELGSYHGSYSGDDDMVADDGGVSWVRGSTHWQPSLLDKVLPKQIAHLELKGQIVEENGPFSFFHPRQRTLFETVQRIEELRKDERVAALLIEVDGLNAGISDMVEIRDALERFQAEGKEVIVYAKSYGLGSYYLASVADHLMLYPTGEVMIPGFNMEMPYLRELLDKVHVEPQFLTAGKYKSAAEILTRDSMSEPAREAREALLESWWDEVLSEIASGREVSREDAEAWIDGALYTADNALAMGMVDELVYPDEVKDKAKDAAGLGDKSPVVPEGIYNKVQLANRHWDDMTSPKIAVVYATGTINTGESSRDFWGGDATMGSATIARAIRTARENPRVDAIVLRVDSPGGSALASDIIGREIIRTVDESVEDTRHIPLYVSMSDVAASGGYYISARADSIFAPPTCVTGSIGVVGGKLVFEGLLDTLGVHFDGVSRGENADIGGVGKWDEEQVQILRNLMDQVYMDFKEHVSEGRSMEMDRVEELAQGRVWSGVDALDRGLTDGTGGLWDVLQLARDRIGAEEGDEVDVLFYPACGGLNFGDEFRGVVVSAMPESLKELLRTEAKLREANTREKVQYRALVDRETVEVE